MFCIKHVNKPSHGIITAEINIKQEVYLNIFLKCWLKNIVIKLFNKKCGKALKLNKIKTLIKANESKGSPKSGSYPTFRKCNSCRLAILNKESWIYVTDNTNIKWIKTFHLYQGFNRRSTSVGNFVKGSARIVEPPRLEYKGFKYKYSLKGDITKGILVRSKYDKLRKSSHSLKLLNNSCIIVKKNLTPQSKFMSGLLLRSSRRRKLLSLFNNNI